MMSRLLATFVLTVALVVYYSFMADNFDRSTIADKRVCITGASSGIGEQLAYHYASLGARLLIVARREALLKKVARKCQELGAKQVEWVTADMGLDKDRDRVIGEVEMRLGGLDQLILNHATLTQGWWLGSDVNMTLLNQEMKVNFVSYVELASKSLKMLTESGGCLGIVGSVAGKFSIPTMATYSSTKFALIGFFSALRHELEIRATGVTVTVCIIGPVRTDILTLTDQQKEEEAALWFDMKASPQDAAWAILRAVTGRQREMYFSSTAWILVNLHKVWPRLVEELIGYFTVQLVAM